MTKPQKIVLISAAGLSSHTMERLGGLDFIAQGYKVVLVDLSAILFHKLISGETKPNAPGEYAAFKNRKEAIAGLRHFFSDCDFIICAEPLMPRTFWVFREISLSCLPYAILSANPIAGIFPLRTLNAPQKARKLELAKRVFRQLGKPKNLFQWLQYFLLKKLKPLRPASLFLLMGGETAALRFNEPIDASTRICWSHASDYDYNLKLGILNQKQIAQHIVFLDEFLPYHQDFWALGYGAAPSTPEEYYPSLNLFFDAIEKHTGLPVVIAAHPSSNYETSPQIFGNRKIEKGKSAQLVHQAKCVLMHVSTAINHAVIHKKPILFLTSDPIAKSYYSQAILDFAEWFDEKVINMDHFSAADVEKVGQSAVSDSVMQRFFHAFIKKAGTPNKTTWTLVNEEIQDILKRTKPRATNKIETKETT